MLKSCWKIHLIRLDFLFTGKRLSIEMINLVFITKKYFKSTASVWQEFVKLGKKNQLYFLPAAIFRVSYCALQFLHRRIVLNFWSEYQIFLLTYSITLISRIPFIFFSSLLSLREWTAYDVFWNHILCAQCTKVIPVVWKKRSP